MYRYIIYTLLHVAMLGTGCAQSTLDEYVAYGLQNNPGLRASQAEFEGAMQKTAQVGALDDPTLRISTLGQMVETRTGQQVARFSLEQMFPWFGTLKEQRNAAALNAEAVFEAYKQEQNEFVFKVKAAYYPLYEIDEAIRLNEENLKILESFKTIAISKFQNGKGKLSDALRVNLLTNDINTDIGILKEKRKSLAIAFNKLLNRGENEEVMVASYKGIEMQTISRDSLANNPQLEVLRKKVLAAQVQERLAEKRAMPKLGLGVEYIITQKRPEMTFSDNGKDAYMVTVSVSLPLYRKKYTPAIKEWQSMQTSFTERQQQVENDLVSQYEMSSFELQQTRQQLSLYQKQIAQTNQIITLLRTTYENDQADFEDILQMQQQLLKYELLEVTARKEYALAIAKLEFLTAN